MYYFHRATHGSIRHFEFNLRGYAGRCAILFPATVISFVRCAIFRMAASQDATDDRDQGDIHHSEEKKLPDKPSGPGTTKVVNAQILAEGYTKGL